MVEPPEQLPAGLEVRHRFRRHRHGLASPRIAAGVRIALPHGEGTEGAQFNPAAARQRTDDVIDAFRRY
jgi:hypothetical protein